jgi:hypothetical protein
MFEGNLTAAKPVKGRHSSEANKKTLPGRFSSLRSKRNLVTLIVNASGHLHRAPDFPKLSINYFGAGLGDAPGTALWGAYAGASMKSFGNDSMMHQWCVFETTFRE